MTSRDDEGVGRLAAETPGNAAWHCVALADAAPMPWRNGGGVTRELLAWPDAQAWRWRLSVADIGTDGPFSSFPGVTRWFAVLEGAGVRLRIDEETHAMDTDSAPLCFDGGSPADCWLQDGPTRDFNLMSRGVSQMQRVRGRCEGRTAAGRAMAVYSHTGPVRLSLTPVATPAQYPSGGAEVLVLPARTLAWRCDGRPWHWQIETGDALWMEMTL